MFDTDIGRIDNRENISIGLRIIRMGNPDGIGHPNDLHDIVAKNVLKTTINPEEKTFLKNRIASRNQTAGIKSVANTIPFPGP